MSVSQKVYDSITNRIINDLEKGVLTWKRSWATGLPKNYFAKHAYRGINRILLPGGEYLTKKQIEGLGGRLIKDDPYEINFYTMYQKPSEEKPGMMENHFLLRLFQVYHLKDTEGIPSRLQHDENNPIELAEEIVKNFANAPKIVHRDTKAPVYNATTDTITIPSIKRFSDVETYYSALFEQLAHSTGHESRLKRVNDIVNVEEFSKEKLLGEFVATMLCGRVGIQAKSINDTPEYIDEWLKVFKKDCRIALQTACRAQSIVDYILGVKETK